MKSLSADEEKNLVAEPRRGWPKRVLVTAARYAYLIVACLAIVAVATYINTYSLRYFVYGRFQSRGQRLDITVADTFGQKSAVIAIGNADSYVTIALEEDSDAREWSRFLDLWHKARQSKTRFPKIIGEMHDTPIGDWTYATFIAGARLRLVFREDDVCVAYDVDETSVRAIDQAFSKVSQHFAGRAPKALFITAKPNAHEVAHIMSGMWTDKPARNALSCERLLHQR